MRLIAHRGASAHAPENTMAAFRLALEMGAKAIELDVHQTKDGELAVIHDQDLKRVAGLKARVGDLTWAELSAVDVGSWFGKDFRGERVPRLGEVMDLSEGKAELHVELKRGSRVYPGVEERLSGLLARRDAWSWAPVSSFDHKALFCLRGTAPKVRLGYLLGLSRLSTAFKEISQLGAESLNMSARQVGATAVRDAHRRGLRVMVYTINTNRDRDRMGKLGVDAIFSNFPELKENEA